MVDFLLRKNNIREMPCGPNFSYILDDSSLFLTTEYKVLQSQSNGCFVRCMKMLYNGKVQLYYVTQGLKSLSTMMPSLDADSFLTIMLNLFNGILQVKTNGFLCCQNLDVSFEKIFVDPATYKVSLIYLPLSHKLVEDITTFENMLRTDLVRLISGDPTIGSPKTRQLCADLSNGMLSLEVLNSRLKGGKDVEPAPAIKPEPIITASATLRLVAMNAPNRVEILVTKTPFLIGKKADQCDGVVSFNRMISRRHCQITLVGNNYAISDMQSANGTYLNRVRLQPNQEYPIQNGDIIRLANSDFQVVIG